jgi:hypothetical protein
MKANGVRKGYCGGIRVSRKASCGRQRAEDKERLRERVLVDEKGTTVSPEVGGRHPYIYMPLWIPRPCGSTTIPR